MKKVVDLRSDTVTLPDSAMRGAMYAAVVGDDVYGEDPTVNKLQETAAGIMDKEAALFLPSGTMGNLVALLAHTKPGDEVIIDKDAHIYYYEVGGMARIAGVMPRPVQGIRGHLTGKMVREAVRAANIHFPEPSLVCLENTHNRAGGTILPMAQLEEVSESAHHLGLKVHMDGARVFNAAAALDVPPADIARHVDSLMFCVSKGMGAPVGSLLAGSEEFIARARKMRKILGGGMRQAGILAAAGLVALKEAGERLVQDHKLAKKLARGLAKTPGMSIDPEDVETNIVVFNIDSHLGTADDFVSRLESNGILSSSFGPQTIRFVTHYQIDQEDIEIALEAVRQVVEEIVL